MINMPSIKKRGVAICFLMVMMAGVSYGQHVQQKSVPYTMTEAREEYLEEIANIINTRGVQTVTLEKLENMLKNLQEELWVCMDGEKVCGLGYLNIQDGFVWGTGLVHHEYQMSNQKDIDTLVISHLEDRANKKIGHSGSILIQTDSFVHTVNYIK